MCAHINLLLHMKQSGWVSVLCALLYGAALPGMVFSTTLEDLAMVRENTAFNLKSHDLPRLSEFNKSLTHENVFIHDDKLSTITMGNLLAVYFDAFACCNILGVHFVYRANISGEDEQATKFFGSFPQIHVHPHPSKLSDEELSKKWRETCPYVLPFPAVHKGAWNQQADLIAQIMRNAVSAVFPDVFSKTIPVASFSSIMPEKKRQKVLPLVPSAAIVFRCVDILFFSSDFPNYGFLNFNAYKELIPKNATTIYILSEELSYQVHSSENRRACTDLSKLLVKFLHMHFPRAIVALRRGHAIDSVAILSNAATVVSAPSTFALFPGIANPNRVYLMASGKRPVFFDQPFVHNNFMWLHSPAVIMGADLVGSNLKNAVKILGAALKQPLSEPVGFATHLPEVDYCAKFSPAPLECVIW